jgi:acyl-coenzyme A thioesterase 13
VFEAGLEVKAIHLNSKGTLHGTVSACLIDWAGGLAIASTGIEKTGVSTDIHTTFIAPAKLGDILIVRAIANQVGATLAFTKVDIKTKLDVLICTGSHTKYVR